MAHNIEVRIDPIKNEYLITMGIRKVDLLAMRNTIVSEACEQAIEKLSERILETIKPEASSIVERLQTLFAKKSPDFIQRLQTLFDERKEDGNHQPT